MRRRRLSTRCAVALAAVGVCAAAIAQERDRVTDAKLSEAARAFDFWLGDWHAESPAGHGSNYVRRILNGHVIEGRYEMPQEEFSGQSLTIFLKEENVFKQMWVDNRGLHNVHFFRWDGSQMIGHKEGFDGHAMKQERVRWFDITDDSFTWVLEESQDSGETWSPSWTVQMTRRGGG